MGDSTKRRHFISNAMAIMRATKGRGLLISSEADGVLGIRAPADVVNLFSVWGLGRERGMEGISINARGVVVNEGLKRTSFRGVVDVIYGGERPMVSAEAVADAKSSKRKVVDVVGNGTPPLSKRALKRAKHAAKEAENGKTSQSTPTEGNLASSEVQPSSTEDITSPLVSSSITPNANG